MIRKLIHSLLGSGLIIALSSSVAFAGDKEVEDFYLQVPEHVRWETSTVAYWSNVKGAREYQVKLYDSYYIDIEETEDGSYDIDWQDEDLEAVVTKRLSDNEYDFSEYMEDGRTYFFVVKATPALNQQAYVIESNWVVSSENSLAGKTVIGITGGKWRNYLEGSQYETMDGEILLEGWHLIQGSWYYLDENGYRKSGTIQVGDEYYYLMSDGKLAIGWIPYENTWYYSNEKGELQTGWIMDVPGEYYYLYENGSLAVDTWIDEYYVDQNGLWVQ